jgi:hypothetical protein
LAKTRDSMNTPAKRQDQTVRSTEADVSAFLDKVKSAPRPAPGTSGRLIFALDATMSRQPTWDQACHIQSEMFQEAGKIAGLQIKLVYFRGFR